MRTPLVCFAFTLLISPTAADDIPRVLPPAGIEIPSADRDRLTTGLDKLQERLDATRHRSGVKPDRLVDVEVLVKAVDYALRGGEFYRPTEFKWADEQLKLAGERLDVMDRGEAPWTAAHGLVVRGFRSALDDAVQPYGLVIADDVDLARPAPLYVWLHGRGDTALDLQFIHQRLTSAGQIQPAGAIVLHPFGRYCNGYKSAGEFDVFEAIEAVCGQYKIDRERILLCGFSMGGAGVWHLGAHYPDRFAAMSPGAGFVDVRRYQGLKVEEYPAWYEQALWGAYDVPDCVRNLLNVPLVAYSGELDKQKAAADIMAEALRGEGLEMTHVIGPGVAHKYEPAALADVLARLRAFQEQGLNRHPADVHLQTRTLRYAKCHWMQIEGLDEHWREARVDAVRKEPNAVEMTTVNANRIRLTSPWPAPPREAVTFVIDGTRIETTPDWTKGVAFEKAREGWRLAVASDEPAAMAKRPGLQGPIDDAFLSPFLVVRPTGRAAHPRVEEWVAAELAHFRERWRTLMRGEFREVDDRDLTDDDAARYNLILWGDASSNQVIARVVAKLPIAWDARSIRAGETAFDAASHMLAMIYPSPLAGPERRYVVLNSGLTFREAHDRTNSLQNPKLPDWAVFDLSAPPDASAAGRVADAGFFDEAWQYQAARSIGRAGNAQAAPQAHSAGGPDKTNGAQ